MRRKGQIYNPSELFRLSRSRVESFLNCPRCFYLDLKFGLRRPGFAPYNLNNAVDTLLKREFDQYRLNNSTHPLMDYYDIDAVPFYHLDLEDWRNNFKGIEFQFPNTNLMLFGAIDDIWELNQPDEKGEKKLCIVDYKATQSDGRVVLAGPWKQIYKRQIEFYQWLFRMNKFNISDVSFFVYCNAKTKGIKRFNGSLKFDVDIIEYIGDDDWVNAVVTEIFKVLNRNKLPSSGLNCTYCKYKEDSNRILESMDL